MLCKKSATIGCRTFHHPLPWLCTQRSAVSVKRLNIHFRQKKQSKKNTGYAVSSKKGRIKP